MAAGWPNKAEPCITITDVSVSIIICTCNRAAHLRQTLAIMGQVRIPAGQAVELVVVDNASTDDTAAVVRDAALANMPVKYLYVSQAGKSNALNVALAQCQSEYLLFTDDDVAVPSDWVEQMVAPLAQGDADAVVGRVKLAPNLMRPWLSAWHQVFLAAVDGQLYDSVGLVGANMAFRRAVLERVPAFDPELGPGPSGAANEESLFGRQLREAGFKLGRVENATVTHHLEESRLQRREWLKAARKYGRTQAYLRHHWEHGSMTAPQLKRLWYGLKLQLRRILQPPPALNEEGCPAWEISYLLEMEECRQFCVERHRPRNYSRHGLIKHNAQSDPDKHRATPTHAAVTH